MSLRPATEIEPKKYALNLRVVVPALLLALLLSGCASLREVDRSRINQPGMDLSAATVLGESSPATGLRNLTGNNGGGACSVCAH